MVCQKCNYIMNEFEAECPRCNADKAQGNATPMRLDEVRNTTFKPSTSTVVHRYPFPVEGVATVARNGMRYGPYSLAQINLYLQSGNILQSDQLLTDSNEWVFLRKIEGIVTPPPAPPPAVIPPPHNSNSFEPSDNSSLFDSEITLNETESRNANALAAFGFLFPIFGLIIWLITLNINPKMASVIGRWSLIGFIVGIVIFTFIRVY